MNSQQRRHFSAEEKVAILRHSTGAYSRNPLGFVNGGARFNLTR
jgi:hypothetical protein